MHGEKGPKKPQQEAINPEDTQKNVQQTFNIQQDKFNIQISQRTNSQRLIKSGLHSRPTRNKALFSNIRR